MWLCARLLFISFITPLEMILVFLLTSNQFMYLVMFPCVSSLVHSLAGTSAREDLSVVHTSDRFTWRRSWIAISVPLPSFECTLFPALALGLDDVDKCFREEMNVAISINITFSFLTSLYSLKHHNSNTQPETFMFLKLNVMEVRKMRCILGNISIVSFL